MSLNHLWAGWRTEYIDDVVAGRPGTDRGSIFEQIVASSASDEERNIVWWGTTCLALLNAYPYTTGHLMILPQRAVAELDELTMEETVELWQGVSDAVRALRIAYQPDGINVGLNLGEAGGAGIPEHLHVHCLPRWSGDTNFMTSVANTRVLPEPLSKTWQKLRDAWPATD